MNQREAREVAEVAKKLRHGPGSGWLRTLAGTDYVGPTPTIAERERRLQIWLDSWILPALDRTAARYAVRKKRGARS